MSGLPLTLAGRRLEGRKHLGETWTGRRTTGHTLRRTTSTDSRLTAWSASGKLLLLGLLRLSLLVGLDHHVFEFVVGRPLDLGDQRDLVG